MISTIPRGPDDLSNAWLESSLGAAPESLESWSAKAIGAGHIAGSYRVSLVWSAPEQHNQPSSLVLKCTHPTQNNRNIARDLWLYRREFGWYRDLAAQSRVRCPGCYFFTMSDDGSEYALLLEDCAPAQPEDQLRGTTADVVAGGIDELALLHAPFMNRADLLAADYLQFDRNFRAEKIEQMQWAWPRFKARYHDCFDSAFFELGDDFTARFDRFVYRQGDAVTLIHNDVRLDNLMTGGTDGRVVLLDWQTLGVGNPMCDLSYFVGTSFADDADRQNAQQSLFEGYIGALNRQGCELDEDALWTAFRVQVFSGFVQAVTAGMLVDRTERGDEMFTTLALRPAQMAMDLDSLSLL